MKLTTNRIALSTVLASILVLATVVPAASADSSTEDSLLVQGVALGGSATEVPRKLPELTTMQIRLNRSAKLTDAVSIKRVAGFEVVAYRFESLDIVGEYSPKSGTSVTDFLGTYFEQFGTQPQVESVVVSLSTEAAERIYKSGELLTAELPGTEFVAVPADASRVDDLLGDRRSAHGIGGESDLLLTPTTWKPEQADIQIYEYAGDVYFSQYFYWGGTYANTSALDPTLGFEMQVDITTDHILFQTGVRPACLNGGFKEQPFATNVTNTWSWYIYANAGYGMYPLNLASVGAYADYNDLGDACNRNSMAIGIRTPQSIPEYPTTGMQEIMVTIVADKGVDDSGEISGTVQPVSEATCDLFPWMANTDCMGVTSTSEPVRPTLAASRHWTAPPICWISMDYGLSAPVQYC